uniref:BPI fold-containing family B member 4-like n=1 Tax=Geotrypetes seraphini TaxID=260995 RepID=A0A6P8P5U9_GEOSA|nr:BPI fold-containing family B member 4-like [Geotrypetes seraphini]
MTVNIISIAHLTTDKDGSPKVILESCQTTYENLVVKALNGVKGEILQSLKSLLDKFMPDVMCPVPDMMLTLLNGMLKDMSGTVPPSSSGALQNTPNRLLINFPTAYGQKMCYV